MSGNNFNVNTINANTVKMGTIYESPPTPTPEIEKVLDTVSEQIPIEEREEILTPIRALASLPVEQQTSEDTKEQAASLYSRCAPYAPAIAKGLATFGKSALAALAVGNPILAGLLAVCELVDKKVE